MRSKASCVGPCRYFPQTFDPNEEHVLLKEMRFRVRHIVVCLLLQKRDEARELLVVLADLVELYVANLQVWNSLLAHWAARYPGRR